MFVIVPLCMVFYYGLTDKSGAFTLDNILAIATAEHSKALWEALKLSVISTVICLLLAYPLAMILCNMNVNQNSFLVLIFILPMWMNFLLRTLAWQTLLEKTGVINSILSTLHLPALNIINTPSAIVLGMVYNFLPFMVLPLYNVLVKIDKSVINAAYDLGANGVQTFVRIIFPLSLPGMFSGITMVFVPALTTFVISKILGGSKILLIGNVIEQEFTQTGNWNLGSGLSIVLMLFIIFNMVISVITDKEGRRTHYDQNNSTENISGADLYLFVCPHRYLDRTLLQRQQDPCKMGRFYDQMVCCPVPERTDHAGSVEYTGAGCVVCTDCHLHWYDCLYCHAIHEAYQPYDPYGNHKYSHAERRDCYRYLPDASVLKPWSQIWFWYDSAVTHYV